MPTENRRVAAYLPKEIDEALTAFKAERGLKGDSPALIAILSEFFGVSQKIAQPMQYQTDLVTIDRVKELIDERTYQLRDQVLEIESILATKLELSSARTSIFQQLQSESDSQAAIGELEGKLLNDIEDLRQRVEALESTKSTGLTLSTGELAKRLGIDSSTLSHWKSTGKKGKSPDELLKATRDRDPDGIGWVVIPETGKFKPERELTSDSQGVLQGSLLNSDSSR
jgi:DNA-binding transcriptional regulator YiaG